MSRHILMISSWYPTPYDHVNGISFRNQALALKRHGCKMGLIAPQFYSLKDFKVAHFRRGFDDYNDEGIPTYRYYNWAWLPKIPYGNSALWIRAGEILLEKYLQDHGRPDLIHANCVLMGGVLAAKIKRQYGIPLVLAEYGNVFDWKHYRFPRWIIKMVVDALRAPDAFIVPSNGTTDFIRDTLGVPVKYAEWIPIAVDHWLFETKLTALKPKNNIFTFLNVANMNVNKGQLDLLEGFGIAFRGNPAIRLRVVGDGPIRKELRQLCVTHGIGAQVDFLGRVSNEQLTAEMTNCNSLVLPSRYETLGTVMVEAMACGKPVVATKCWGPLSIVKENCGVLVPVQDPPSLGQAMADMVRDIEKYDSVKIRQYCIDYFSEKVVCEKTARVYEKVLNHG